MTIPIVTSSTLFALVNVKYLWEFGARSKSEGRTLVLTATFPVLCQNPIERLYQY